MPKEAVFTLKLKSNLRAAFVSEAQASHRPASQILRELMREFVERQRPARIRVKQRCGQRRSKPNAANSQRRMASNRV